MSKASSAISNLSSSPLGSTIDLNDEKLFNQEIRNKKSNKQSLTMAFDPEELINVAIQEHAALNKDYVSYFCDHSYLSIFSFFFFSKSDEKWNKQSFHVNNNRRLTLSYVTCSGITPYVRPKKKII